MWSLLKIDLPLSWAVIASWRRGSLGQSSHNGSVNVLDNRLVIKYLLWQHRNRCWGMSKFCVQDLRES